MEKDKQKMKAGSPGFLGRKNQSCASAPCLNQIHDE